MVSEGSAIDPGQARMDLVALKALRIATARIRPQNPEDRRASPLGQRAPWR